MDFAAFLQFYHILSLNLDILAHVNSVTDNRKNLLLAHLMGQYC